MTADRRRRTNEIASTTDRMNPITSSLAERHVDAAPIRRRRLGREAGESLFVDVVETVELETTTELAAGGESADRVRPSPRAILLQKRDVLVLEALEVRAAPNAGTAEQRVDAHRLRLAGDAQQVELEEREIRNACGGRLQIGRAAGR